MPLRSRTRSPAAPALVVGLVAGLALASGCAGDPSSAGGSSSTRSASGPSASASSTAADPAPSTSASTSSTSSTSSASSPAPTPSASGTAGASGAPTALRDRLLTASRMPGFDDRWRWREAGTGPERPSTSFGTCQRFGIVSIGAERAVVRRFAPVARGASHARAGELVAQFPDPLTARRAYAVLEAWRTGCADRLKGRTGVHVGELQPVAAGDRAGWYLLRYGPVPGKPDARFRDAQGMVIEGRRIAMVALLLAGQDHDHRPGHEPAVVALHRAASALR